MIDLAQGSACSAEEARELTDRIKASVEQTWALLLEAHDRHAWSALGYDRWEDYVRGEFDMARSTSYQLVDQGRVIQALRGVSANADIVLTEKEARDIKPVLSQVVEQVREAVRDVQVDDRPAVVERVISETRGSVRGVRSSPSTESNAEVDRETAIEEINSITALFERGKSSYMTSAIRYPEDLRAMLASRLRDWADELTGVKIK